MTATNSAQRTAHDELENQLAAARATYTDALWAMRRVPKGSAYLADYRRALSHVTATYAVVMKLEDKIKAWRG